MTLADVTTIPAYAVIIRAIHERGAVQAEALEELKRRVFGSRNNRSNRQD